MSHIIFVPELAHNSLRERVNRFSDAVMATEVLNDARAYRRLVQDFFVMQSLFNGHSVAENEVIIPNLTKRAGELPYQCHEEHHEESDYFVNVEHVLLKLNPSAKSNLNRSTSAGLDELKKLTQLLRINSLTHMWKEDNFLFPLIEKHFSISDLQRLASHILAQRDVQRALQLVGPKGFPRTVPSSFTAVPQFPQHSHVSDQFQGGQFSDQFSPWSVPPASTDSVKMEGYDAEGSSSAKHVSENTMLDDILTLEDDILSADMLADMIS